MGVPPKCRNSHGRAEECFVCRPRVGEVGSSLDLLRFFCLAGNYCHSPPVEIAKP